MLDMSYNTSEFNVQPWLILLGCVEGDEKGLMLYYVRVFNRNLSSLDVSKVADMGKMFHSSSCLCVQPGLILVEGHEYVGYVLQRL